MNPTIFAKAYEEKQNAFLKAFHAYLDDLEATIPNMDLRTSMLYSLKSSGKYFRPVLMMASHELACQTSKKTLAYSQEALMAFAIGTELIHTYSLIHDDLPAMDDDTLRRGQASNHVAFGEAMAILAGDALNTQAFECCSRPLDLTPSIQLKCIHILSKAAGSQGMVSGQAHDINGPSSTKPILSHLQQTHSLKTGALIRSSVSIGAILGGITQDVHLKTLDRFAQHLGICFQIADDLLGTVSQTQTMGKHAKSDAKNNHLTYLSHLGQEKAKQELKSHLNQGLEALQTFDPSEGFLGQLIHFAAHRFR